jgi:hypothetical protein
MITNDGRDIVAKALLGQIPDYATFIACGCGGTPLNPSEIQTEQELLQEQSKKSLDFETFRVPITSRGLVKEDGQEKVVFKATMPTEQRFLVSEVALFPESSNALAGQYDSKTLATFVPDESWVIYSSVSSSTISVISSNDLSDQDDDIIVFDPAYFILSDDKVFDNDQRALRQEPPRFYTHSLAISGSSSYISPIFDIDASSFRIENSRLNFDFSQNLPVDEVKFAISLLSRQANVDSNPEKIRMVIEFVNEVTPDINFIPPKARLNIELQGSEFINRYKIITRTLSEFIVDDNFSWANVTLSRIYSCVVNSQEESIEDYIVSFDGMRLDNVSTENPLYSMVAYSKIRNDNSLPVEKPANTNNFIEYRLNIGVG